MSTLQDFSDEALSSELKWRKADRDRKAAMSSPDFRRVSEIDPVGLWKVTTEGDVEGRSVKDLGTWPGHIADIAFALADQAGSVLQFQRVNPKELEISKSAMPLDRVAIRLDCGTGAWDLKQSVRVTAYQKIISKSAAQVSCYVCENDSFASVSLVRKKERSAKLTRGKKVRVTVE